MVIGVYSSNWTVELKNQYKYYEKEDGDFFMGYKYFMAYFVTMGFAKLLPKWSSTKLKVKKNWWKRMSTNQSNYLTR